MPKAIQISAAEWDVMEAVWDAGPCTAAAVIELLSVTHDWNHRTIRTLLARLIEKGALKYEVNGTSYIYQAAVSRKQCVREESRSFVKKIFRGNVRELLAHFVEEETITTDELRELRKLLDQKQSRGRKNR